MPMDASRYPPNWAELSAAAKQAAGWCCQECGVPHLAWGWRDPTGAFHQVDPAPLADRGLRPPFDLWTGEAVRHLIRIILTVSHVDHDTANSAPGNLRALCQRCHLAYDLHHHMKNAANTRAQARLSLRATMALGDLLDLVPAPAAELPPAAANTSLHPVPPPP